MKKIATKISAVICIMGICHHGAKAQAFEKGTGVLNLGLGFGGKIAYWGPGYSSTPYFNVTYDHGVYVFDGTANKLCIGVGGFLGYRSVWYQWTTTWVDKNGRWHYDQPVKSTWNYIGIGFRPTLNYSFNDKGMVYAALPIGIYSVNHKYNNPDYYSNVTYSSTVFSSGFMLGGRYFFSKSFGIYGELGWGFAFGNLGVSFRF